MCIRDSHDIIQAVTFNNPDAMIAFCEGIQAAAPVDSYVTPEPWAMPGYDSDVLMAAGAFVQGSSIELSADAVSYTHLDVYKRQIIDSSTRRNLELVETMREKQKRGSLLWVLDKTKTAMGARPVSYTHLGQSCNWSCIDGSCGRIYISVSHEAERG